MAVALLVLLMKRIRVKWWQRRRRRRWRWWWKWQRRRWWEEQINIQNINNADYNDDNMSTCLDRKPHSRRTAIKTFYRHNDMPQPLVLRCLPPKVPRLFSWGFQGTRLVNVMSIMMMMMMMAAATAILMVFNGDDDWHNDDDDMITKWGLSCRGLRRQR